MSKIISLNFINKNNICLNPDNYPIIYFWDGYNTIFDTMLEDVNFINLLTSQYCTVENYTNINIYMNEYDLELESYSQEILELQSKMPLNLEILHQLAYKYIETILIDLHKISLKKDFEELSESSVDNIIKIYTILENKYKERISYETLKKYILSQLQQKYNLNNDNCEYIINLYSEIIDL